MNTTVLLGQLVTYTENKTSQLVYLILSVSC
jgi:hypothetical protein